MKKLEMLGNGAAGHEFQLLTFSQLVTGKLFINLKANGYLI